jgi:hypothetical protein
VGLNKLYAPTRTSMLVSLVRVDALFDAIYDQIVATLYLRPLGKKRREAKTPLDGGLSTIIVSLGP